MEKSTLLQIVSMQNALMQEMIFVFPRLGATPAHPFFLAYSIFATPKVASDF